MVTKAGGDDAPPPLPDPPKPSQMIQGGCGFGKTDWFFMAVLLILAAGLIYLSYGG